MQMLLLVCNNTSEAEREVSLFVVVKPQPPAKPLRLKGGFLKVFLNSHRGKRNEAGWCGLSQMVDGVDSGEST